MPAVDDVEHISINLNGETVKNDIVGYYVDKSIKTVKLLRIHKGKNELILTLPFGELTNTEWCYILGEFNVRVEGTMTTIIPKTDTVGFSSLVNQGMLFYGGNVTYSMEIETPECEAVLCTSYYRGGAVRVFIDGEKQ